MRRRGLEGCVVALVACLGAAPVGCGRLAFQGLHGADRDASRPARDGGPEARDAEQDGDAPLADGPCLPSAEICNDRDDDCDGRVDDEDDGALCPDGAATQAVVACLAGTCAVAECVGARGDCDGLLANGCETRLHVPSHCGACDARCGPDPEACHGGALGALPWCTGHGSYLREFVSDRGPSNIVGSAYAAAFGDDGSLFVAGYFGRNVDFGGGERFGGDAGRSLFVVRYGADGAHSWDAVAPCSGTTIVRGLVVDGTGNVFVAGWVSGVVDFGDGPRTDGVDWSAAYVVSYDSTGVYRWARMYGDPSSLRVLGAIGAGPAGSIVFPVYFEGSEDFGGGARDSAAPHATALVALDGDGEHLWDVVVPRFNASSLAASPGGEIRVGGTFSGTVDFGGGPRASDPPGGLSSAVVALGPGGAHVWDRVFHNAAGSVVALGSAGHTAIAGKFTGPTDLGDGALVATGTDDFYVALLDAAGAVEWTRTFVPPGTASVGSVLADESGQVWTLGWLTGPYDFGGGPIGGYGGPDAFALALDASGGHRWSRMFGGAGADGFASGAVRAGVFVGAGWFMETVDFGGGARTAGHGDDPFVVVLGD